MRLVLALALVLLAPAAASATTVGLDPAGGRVLVTDAEGVANDLRIAGATNAVTIEDAAAPLTAQAPCDQLQPGLVRCPASGVAGVLAQLGGGDDRVAGVAAGGLVTLDGGPGDDELGPVTGVAVDLLGGDGDDRLAGGDGADVLDGGDGTDTLLGGPGADTLRPGPQGPRPPRADADDDDQAPPLGAGFDADVLDGGDGGDVVVYDGEGPVTVDLRQGLAFPGTTGATTPEAVRQAATGPGRPAPATLTGVESATGGASADTLFAGDGGGTLRGGAGGDLLVGGAGDDGLLGGTGDDEVAGGDGDDLIRAAAGRDRVDAGRGDDRVDVGTRGSVLLGPGDDVLTGTADADDLGCGTGTDSVAQLRRYRRARDCEATLLRSGMAVGRTLRRMGARRWRTTVRCAEGPTCGVRGGTELALARTGRPLDRTGARRATFRAGQQRAVTFRVTAAADARLRRARTAVVRVGPQPGRPSAAVVAVRP